MRMMLTYLIFTISLKIDKFLISKMVLRLRTPDVQWPINIGFENEAARRPQDLC